MNGLTRWTMKGRRITIQHQARVFRTRKEYVQFRRTMKHTIKKISLNRVWQYGCKRPVLLFQYDVVSPLSVRQFVIDSKHRSLGAIKGMRSQYYHTGVRTGRMKSND
ncbi:hypothetical protein [Bacillus paranthracis]|uniref:hypothetical protein n=1 Tax=Bacillus paranthracis TaxID=2026186 RepID=UPI0022E5ED49|nr:hypothetical protein [Bacillus paranthracis]